uniref:LITAF domain-containing protein n=1 Tax=Oncorhynchus kisutch TaxID=8019 RepID=A0A8C7JPS0_ONCKI
MALKLTSFALTVYRLFFKFYSTVLLTVCLFIPCVTLCVELLSYQVSLPDAKHTCPSCKTLLGVYKRL